MSVQIAFLRGINVGGRNMVAMSDLRELLEMLGFTGAQSLLQSGNLVFQSSRLTGTSLERLLEAETEKRLKVSVDFVVRSADELKKIIARNPFPEEAKRDPSHLLIMFLKKEVQAADVQKLQTAIKGPEIVRAAGKQVYIVYPEGIGRSKLTNAFAQQKLGSRGTARNWNTVIKLDALARSL